MTQNISGANVSASLIGRNTDPFPLHSPITSFLINQSSTITQGEGDAQINYVWGKTDKVGRSGSTTINLRDGSQKDIYDNVMSLKYLKTIIVVNRSETESKIRITTNGIGFIGGTTPYVNIEQNSHFGTVALNEGWEITAGSADTITIENINPNDGAIYEIFVSGTYVEASSSSSSYSSGSSDSSSSSSSESSS